MWAVLSDRATPAMLPWVDLTHVPGHLPMEDVEPGTKATVHWMGQDPHRPAPCFRSIGGGREPVYWTDAGTDPSTMVPPMAWLERGGYVAVQEDATRCPEHFARVKSFLAAADHIPGQWLRVDFACGCYWAWDTPAKRHRFHRTELPELAPFVDAKAEDRARAIGGEDAVQHIHDAATAWAEEHGLEYGDPRGVAYDAYQAGYLDAVEQTLTAVRISLGKETT